MSSSPSSPHPSSPYVDDDFQYIIEAVLAGRGLKILVAETRFQDQLRNRGFGEKEDSEYILKPYEALYLIHTKRLVLKSKKDDLDFDSLTELILKYDKDILTRFLIYRDLRSRGYIAKEGFGFGVDFRVYERGEFEKKPSKYIVFGMNEGVNIKANNFSCAIEQIRKMGKDAVIAVIERRGGIIYYKVSKTLFAENNKTYINII
ncbi:MAG TPA: tRNA-intron lyase [Nitrososphaeraceae archaeon]|nr:tRNA-intron lyase [Nitrososphaeraceae archaeon]